MCDELHELQRLQMEARQWEDMAGRAIVENRFLQEENAGLVKLIRATVAVTTSGLTESEKLKLIREYLRPYVIPHSAG